MTPRGRGSELKAKDKTFEEKMTQLMQDNKQ